MKKWLYRVPKSAEQVLAIINEANDTYAEYKRHQKQSKIDLINSIYAKNIFTGSIVNAIGFSKISNDEELEVLNIKGTGMIVKSLLTGQRWNLKTNDHKAFKLVKEVNKNDKNI